MLFFISRAINQVIDYLNHPLENAVVKADIDGIKQAIAKGCDVNAEDDSSHTILTSAIWYGRYSQKIRRKPELRQQRIFEMLEILINAGANVNVSDRYGETPLIAAISSEYHLSPFVPTEIKEPTKIINLLIANGADVNIKNRVTGNAPLHEAVYLGNLEIIAILIENGANVNVENVYVNGEKPLKIALENDNKEVVELLRRHGAKE